MGERRAAIRWAALSLAQVGLACGPTEPLRAPRAAVTPQPTPTDARMVDVGGYRLFIECVGGGSPTVILDAAANRPSAYWAAVMQDLAPVARVCRYDRAGLGRSEAGPRPRTSGRMVQELRALLTNADVSGPYLLVGHSLGGLNAQLFASRFPAEVAALVLVEATPPDYWEDRFHALLTPAQAEQSERDILAAPEHLTLAELRQSNTDARQGGGLPDVPLVVVRRGRPMNNPPDYPTARIEQLWGEEIERLAARSLRSRTVVATRSGHMVPQDEPAVISRAVREVLRDLRVAG